MTRETPEYLRELSRIVQPAPDEQEAAERRRRMIAHIDRLSPMLQAAEARRRKTWRLLSLTAAASFVGLVGLAGWQALDSNSSATGPATETPSAGSKSEAARASSTPAQERTRLADGRHETGQALRETETLASGTTLGIGSMTRFSLSTEQFSGYVHERLTLEKGSLDLRVPSLGPGGLTVVTPEATVQVRGTEFSVERFESGERRDAHPGAAEGSKLWHTRVLVAEGLVKVEHGGQQVLLNSGDEWLSGADTRAGALEVEPKTGALGHEHRHSASRSSAERAGSTTPQTPEQTASLLAEQNRLYQSAVLARRRGLTSAARERFLELLQRYPESPLASSAERELNRLNEESQQ